MPEIKHFIVLMMENRSFDHMLGYLESAAYPIDGLLTPRSNANAAGATIVANRSARYSGDLTTDPHHDFDDVTEQLFGTASPAAGQTPDMSGFVRNFERYAGSDAANIMNCFDPANLPVLTKLAQSYAVCDRWFCSVPGPTLPNRLYAHAGTSRGRLDMSPDYIGGFRTLYEVLWNCEVESAIFYHDWSGTLSFEFLLTHQSEIYAPFNRFTELCANDRLPAYCFIEPRYNPQSDGGPYLPPNDQHPDHDVAAGEQLIRDVYLALRRNDDVWKSSLLLIVYDEHGGTYDHVPPGACDSPDGMVSVNPPFDFKRYGPRVPAVIVSPYVAAGTIVNDRICDHTSIIATTIRLFATKPRNRKGIDWPSNVLGLRAMNAAPIDDVLDLSATPRMDTPTFPSHRAAASGPPPPTTAPVSGLQAEAVAHAAALERRLPADMQTRRDPAAIENEHEAGAYVSAVARAALRARRDRRLVR
jgi:phospholipase C